MKATPKKLLSDIAEDFSQFLKKGSFFEFQSFSKKIYLNIDNIETLLRIHFVLTRKNNENQVGVIDFIHTLPERIRRIKTTTSSNTELSEGEVKGRINWKKTIEKMILHYPIGNTTFAYDKRERDYEIPENLVLKQLLKIIWEIVNTDLNPFLDYKYNWLKGWIDKAELKKSLDRLYSKNIYLKRINLGKKKINKRMINRALKSRNILYREAALLLSRYHRIMNFEFDEIEAVELLKNTFIIPERPEVLFELYWIILLLKEFKEVCKNLEYKLIKPNQANLIAEWEYNNHIFKIFHDSTANLKFSEKIKDLKLELENKFKEEYKDDDNYFSRELKVHSKLKELKLSGSDSFWSGRPDIIIKVIDKNNILKILLIGEVKYTNYRDYGLSGLRELLEYMAFVREDVKPKKYFEEYKHLFEDSVKLIGVLFTDDIEKFKVKMDENNLKVIMFGHKNQKIALKNLIQSIIMVL